MRILKIVILSFFALIVIYFLGPKPAAPNYNNNLIQVPSEPAALESYIKTKEAAHKVKTDNATPILPQCSIPHTEITFGATNNGAMRLIN